MTIKQIEARMKKEQIPFQLAIEIRKLLDAAKKEYGASDWDNDDVETKVMELVTEEG